MEALGREAFVASQRQQAVIRIAVATLFLGYLAAVAPGFAAWRSLVLGSWAFHLLWNLACLFWWIPRQAVSVARVVAGMTLDIYLIAMAMFVDGGVASPLGVLLLSPMLANGMRYGRMLLVYGAALATAALVAVGVLAGELHAPADWLRLAAEAFGLNYIGFYALDILAQRERESRARRELERSVRRMLEGWPVPALLVRMASGGGVRVVGANEGVRSLGIEPETIRGARPERLCVPGEGESLAALCREAVRDGSAQGFVRLAREGGETPVEVRAFALPVGGRPEVLVLLEDIAQALRERRALAEAQKQAYAAALAAGLAHDFRNLLTTIIGEAEILGSESGDPGVRRTTDRIIAMGEHGAEVVGEFLRFARDGRTRLVPVRLDEALPHMLELVRMQLPPGVRLETDIEPGLPAVAADPAKVQQMLLNLVDNAVQAMRGEGVIAVRVRRDGARVALEVEDSGPGIAPEHLPHLFQPFWTTRTHEGGTGLGLAMVRALAAWQDAEVEVDPRPGRGACFRVRFAPAGRHARPQPEPARPEPAPDGAGDPLAGACVLVVDDEPLVLEATAEMLERLGARTLRAGSCAEARRVLEAHGGELDAALLDWCMPDGCGGDLARHLRARFPELPIVFATGHPEELRGDPEAEACPVLAKPVRAARLARVLAEAIAAA